MVTKETIYTTQTTLLQNLKLQNTVNTNCYQGNNPHNTNHSSNKHQTPKKCTDGVIVSMLGSIVVENGSS